MENPESKPLSCKISDSVSITFSFEGLSSYNEYRSFCDEIKRDYYLKGLSEEEVLKLYLLSNLMEPSTLESFFKGTDEVVIPCARGRLKLRGLVGNDCLSISGMGTESLKRDNRADFICSQYVLNLRLSPNIILNKDIVYHFLMNFGAGMKWTQQPKVAEIISSCVNDISENVRKDDTFNKYTIRYKGQIEWQKLKDHIKKEFGAIIKIRRSEKSDIWNVYISILESLFKYDVQSIVRSHRPIRKGIWIEESLHSIIEEIKHKYNVEVKEWQIKGMIKKPLSNKKVSDILIDIVRSKLEIYPFLTD